MELSKSTGGGGFPQRLKELRAKKGASQQTVADFCYLSRSTVERYEQGEGLPGLEAAIALADYFGVSLDDLMGR